MFYKKLHTQLRHVTNMTFKNYMSIPLFKNAVHPGIYLRYKSFLKISMKTLKSLPHTIGVPVGKRHREHKGAEKKFYNL